MLLRVKSENIFFDKLTVDVGCVSAAGYTEKGIGWFVGTTT